VRRLPALYGREPINLVDWLLRPDDAEQSPDAAAALTQAAQAMETEDIEERLQKLRARRDAEEGER